MEGLGDGERVEGLGDGERGEGWRWVGCQLEALVLDRLRKQVAMKNHVKEAISGLHA